MTISNYNKEFLCRLKYILGGRNKHPWGEPLGIKPARIQTIFKGIVPQADALEVIYRAEKVRIEWLIGASNCPPFEVTTWMSDAEVITHCSDLEKALHLITDNHGQVLTATTQNKVHEYLDNRGNAMVANYEDVTVYYPVSEGAITQIKELSRDITLVTADPDTVGDIAAGRKGPAHIRELIKTGGKINSSNMSLAVRPETDVGKSDKELFDKLQLLTDEQRVTMINLLRMLVTETDIKQTPPRSTIDPDHDLETENQPVTVESQTPPPDEIDPND